MNDVPSLRLPPREERAALLRAKGWSKAAVSRDEEVAASLSTIDRWCERPEFIARVEALRMSVDLQATEILQESLTHAAKVMRDILMGNDIDVRVVCEACGTDVTSTAVAEVRLRQKTAQWLLDTHFKGKLPSVRKKDPEEEAADSVAPDARDDMLERGKDRGDAEDDYDEDDEPEEGDEE